MTDDDRLLLDIATRLYLVEGSRDRAFRDEALMRPVHAWQRIYRLLNDEDALRAEPEKVLRLRRQLKHRMTQRRAS